MSIDSGNLHLDGVVILHDEASDELLWKHHTRLIDKHRHIYRRVSDMRRWFVWDGQRWTQDYEDHNIRQAAIELARQLPEADKDQKVYKRNSHEYPAYLELELTATDSGGLTDTTTL